MNSYLSFLIGAIVLSIAIDLTTWVRFRLLAATLNAILFAVVGLVILLKLRPGGDTELFGYLSLVMAAGWTVYGFLRYRRIRKQRS